MRKGTGFLAASAAAGAFLRLTGAKPLAPLELPPLALPPGVLLPPKRLVVAAGRPSSSIFLRLAALRFWICVVCRSDTEAGACREKETQGWKELEKRKNEAEEDPWARGAGGGGAQPGGGAGARGGGKRVNASRGAVEDGNAVRARDTTRGGRGGANALPAPPSKKKLFWEEK
jgi:hypothetical protein